MWYNFQHGGKRRASWLMRFRVVLCFWNTPTIKYINNESIYCCFSLTILHTINIENCISFSRHKNTLYRSLFKAMKEIFQETNKQEIYQNKKGFWKIFTALILTKLNHTTIAAINRHQMKLLLLIVYAWNKIVQIIIFINTKIIQFFIHLCLTLF